MALRTKPLKKVGNCISANPKFNFFRGGGVSGPQNPRQTRPYGARERHQASPVSRVPPLSNTWLRHCNSWVFLYTCMWCSE